jgi:hypothetical protein
MTLAEFWRATPRETVMCIQAARWRDEEATRRAMSAAWHTANLAGSTFSGKMPRHDTFLPPRHKKQKPMGPVQTKTHLEALFARFPRKKKEPKP